MSTVLFATPPRCSSNTRFRRTARIKSLNRIGRGWNKNRYTIRRRATGRVVLISPFRLHARQPRVSNGRRRAGRELINYKRTPHGFDCASQYLYVYGDETRTRYPRDRSGLGGGDSQNPGEIVTLVGSKIIRYQYWNGRTITFVTFNEISPLRQDVTSVRRLECSVTQ